MPHPKPTVEAIAFFYDHAGFNYPTGASEQQQRQCRHDAAVTLATAEAIAHDKGWVFRWSDDPDGRDVTDTSEAPVETCEVCVAFADADDDTYRSAMASLGAIWDAAPEYRRVIEAELAEESLARFTNGGAR